MKLPRARTTTVVAAVLILAAAVAGALAAFGRDGHKRSPNTPEAETSALPSPLLAAALGSIAPSGASSDRRRQTSLEIAERVGSRFHLTVTSGYRDPRHNAEVGGAEGSYHTRGTEDDPGAVDLIGSTSDMRAALAWARAHVPNLAEGMIHAVCVVDEERPWNVADGGLHLHLAFAPSRNDADARSPYIQIATRSGCRSAADRFRAAQRMIVERRSHHDWTTGRAARATIRAAAMALGGDYGALGDRGRTLVADARDQATTTLHRVIAARRDPPTTTKKRSAYERYLSRLQATDERESTGSLSADEARIRRLAITDAALAGEYGSLSASERAAVVIARSSLVPAPDDASPTATTPAPVPETTQQPTLPATPTAPATTPAP